MCLVGVVVRRYIDFLILPPTPLVSALFFAAASLLFIFFKCFSFLFQYIFLNFFLNFFAQYKHIPAITGIPRKPYEGLHVMFYTQSTHKRTLHILRWTSAV